MVAQATGMDVGRFEVMAQGEHRQQRRVAGLVAKVVFKLATGEFRTAVRLCGDELCVFVRAVEDVAHEGEGNAAEVGTATEAGDHLVGILPGHLHLLLSFQSDDGLMEGDMVQHRAQRVFTSRCGGGQLDGLRDRCTQGAGMVGVSRDDVLSGACRHRGRSFHSSAEGAHDHRAVRLLLHRDLHLIHGGLQSVELGGIAERGTPLSGTGLGGHVGVAFLFAIVALGQGGVDLMGT